MIETICCDVYTAYRILPSPGAFEKPFQGLILEILRIKNNIVRFLPKYSVEYELNDMKTIFCICCLLFQQLSLKKIPCVKLDCYLYCYLL